MLELLDPNTRRLNKVKSQHDVNHDHTLPSNKKLQPLNAKHVEISDEVDSDKAAQAEKRRKEKELEALGGSGSGLTLTWKVGS